MLDVGRKKQASRDKSTQTPLSSGRHSRIPGFYRMDIARRLEILKERGVLDENDIALLTNRHGGLEPDIANQMVENVIGVLELPMGLGLNFVINGKDYLIPMAVEEPSIIAAVSHVAKIARQCGGFNAQCDKALMIGQIQVVGCENFDDARLSILANKERLIEHANRAQPSMVNRGGGVKDIEVRVLDEGSYRSMLVVHVLIDTKDAMGANFINSVVESMAPDIESITNGKVFLRILSNLADRRLVQARVEIPVESLAWKSFSGMEVAQGIALASEFADSDPYRAATHNKGIMNGIGAVCVATGNDWRALEAGAHAYCARDGKYRPMATWKVIDDKLVGALEIPLAVGTVGGPILLHPTVKLAHKILQTQSANELAEVMGAVGLAQNMAALKALATEGIQRGHMSLHARSVAATAGARPDELEAVVEMLINDGDIKVSRAQEILAQIRLP